MGLHIDRFPLQAQTFLHKAPEEGKDPSPLRLPGLRRGGSSLLYTKEGFAHGGTVAVTAMGALPNKVDIFDEVRKLCDSPLLHCLQ
jgi:hypothetical protein